MAFYAAKEIKFIRENARSLDLLPMSRPSSVVDFADRAGKRFADMWIRREIHDAGEGDVGGVIFLTCDLMNSMAAEAEGIVSCYFSRLPQNSVFLTREHPKQLAEFIMASAIVFGQVKLDFLPEKGDATYSICIEGVWEGKTTFEWYSDRVRVTDVSTSG